MNLMENNLEQWEMASVEDDLNERLPQWKMTSMEDKLKGRRAQ
jgi:hypothetical protein